MLVVHTLVTKLSKQICDQTAVNRTMTRFDVKGTIICLFFFFFSNLDPSDSYHSLPKNHVSMREGVAELNGLQGDRCTNSLKW